MKTSSIPTLLGPDGMTSLREYAGYHGGGSGFGGQLRAWNPPSESVDAALLEEVARNASAVAQNTAAAKKSASDASTSAREAAICSNAR